MALSAELANITWMLLTAALVMLMQGGFCCLESGLARAKNSINVAIKNLSDFCVSSVLFWVCGFGLMFGRDAAGLVGVDSFALSGAESPWLLAFFLFQLVFCGTATTIVSGAVAERMKFSAYLIISAIISAIIYPVFGHWAWGGVVEGTGRGWLVERGFIDFAGSTVVHSVGGWVALTAVILVGPRIGRFRADFPRIHGNNYPLATLGTMLLWFGWFGFNGGSTLVIDGSVPLVLVNTNLAAGAGGLAALFLSWWVKKRTDVGDIMNGVIAGLVGITASCHIMTPAAAVLIGAIAGVISLVGAAVLERGRIDDVIGAVPVHAFAGVWGTLAVALLADPSRFPDGHTHWQQFQVQLLGVGVCFGWCTAMTAVLLGAVSVLMGLRVSPEAEIQGLNISEHGASTELIDLLTDMRRQSENGDFNRTVAVEPHTEVGQIAAEYNKVLDKVVDEIEGREQLVKQLRVAEEKFRSIFENATEGIFRFALDGQCLDANPALAQILGYPDAPTLVAEVRDLRSQLFVDTASRDAALHSLITDKQLSNYETVLYRRDGSMVEVSLNARCFTGENATGDYFEGSLRDITQRREAERFRQEKEAAESASRAKSAFLATMSHEIRTPLNGVIGMLELLTNSNLTEKQHRYTGIAKSSAQALLSLINDILDFSKIEAGKLELHQAEFDLPMLLEEVADMFGHRAEHKGLELSCHVLPDVPLRVTGDCERIRQILINLVGNAIKFTESGEVRIRVRETSAAGRRHVVRFEVEDTGVGIPDEIQSRLFQVFEQADSSTTRKYGGTGLGLAICRQLVELMQGKIGVSSRIGSGSLFWCEIPFEAARTSPSRRRCDVRIAGMRVLAVDDNETNLQILGTHLTSWQAQVQLARNAGDAMRMLKAAAAAGEHFGLAILDHEMPGVDGIELARRIHADPDLDALPLIMLTSSDSPARSDVLETIGIRACCTKPILQSRLFDVLISTLFAAEGYASSSDPVRTIVPAAATSGANETRRVLIADDNEINQMVTQEILEKAGYQCRIAHHGQEAVELLKKRHFDIVLMDCQMPVMDGFSATHEIRALQAAGTLPETLPNPVPIIALTANAVMGDRERCLAAGMTDYVTKPVDPEQLLSVMAKHGGTSKSTSAAGSATRAGASPGVDWAGLRDRCGGDAQFARKVMDKFRSRIQSDYERITAAWERRSFDESRQLAHALKGSAASVSAIGIAETAGAVEAAARAGRAAETAAHLEELRERVQECLQQIEQQMSDALRS